RIDILPYAAARLRYDIRRSGYDPGQIEKIWHLEEISTHNYAAFSPSTDDRIVERFQRGFDAVKKKGIQDRILKKWEKRLQEKEEGP
ncbi:MAG: hypothetical protein MI862_29455, partial [Desulfobacterales bacterium]|nr:hypothetical protein [Desulfobacterales bacterium]